MTIFCMLTESNLSTFSRGLGLFEKRLSGGKTRQLLIGNFLCTDWKWGEIPPPMPCPCGPRLIYNISMISMTLRTSAYVRRVVGVPCC